MLIVFKIIHFWWTFSFTLTFWRWLKRNSFLSYLIGFFPWKPQSLPIIITIIDQFHYSSCNFDYYDLFTKSIWRFDENLLIWGLHVNLAYSLSISLFVYVLNITFEIMKKGNNAVVLTLLTNANLKTFFIDDAIPLPNFEFRKKKFVLLLIKDLFYRGFHSCKFFHKRVCCVKKEPKDNLIEIHL